MGLSIHTGMDICTGYRTFPVATIQQQQLLQQQWQVQWLPLWCCS